MYKFDKIFVCGDIHGFYDAVPNYLKTNKLNNVAVIVAGDFGIGFDSADKELSRLEYLHSRMRHHNSVCFVVRGNHDDPFYFNGDFQMLDNVKLLKDYSVLNINDLNFLFVGGAVSIDRTQRRAFYGRGRDWWKDELFVYNAEIVKNINGIDIVVTHSAPDFCYPTDKSNIRYWMSVDAALETNLNQERTHVTYLYDHLYSNGNIIKQWYYGHFHLSNEMYLRDTKFIALNINEHKEVKIEDESI